MQDAVEEKRDKLCSILVQLSNTKIFEGETQRNAFSYFVLFIYFQGICHSSQNFNMVKSVVQQWRNM